MPTTKGRWGSKLALSLFVKNAKDEKQHSSSTLPKAWATTWYIQEMSVLKLKMRQLFSKSMLIDWKQ
jgi:hypothetical protein